MTQHPGAGFGACAEALAALQTLLDGELDRAAALDVGAHLEACLPCESEADAYRRLKQAVSCCGNDLDPDVLARLREFASALVETGSGSPS